MLLLPRIIISLMLLLISTTVVSGQLEDGFIVYQRGDKELAKQKWLPLAIKGDVRAQFFLSVLFDGGTSAADKDNAKRWLTASANNGFIPARFNLGNNYHQGKYDAVNNKMAEYWWNQAAVQGFPEAQYQLAALYYWGRSGVRTDQEEAFYWFKQAANQGYQPAAEALLLMRAKEQLLPPDRNMPVNIAYDDHRIISKLKLDAKQISAATTQVDLSSTSTPGSEPKQKGLAAQHKETVSVDKKSEYLENDWISQQPGDNYTIQLYASTELKECKARVKRLYHDHLLEAHAQPFIKNGHEYCAVIYGSYVRYSLAKTQLSQLPRKLRQDKPWIRNLDR